MYANPSFLSDRRYTEGLLFTPPSDLLAALLTVDGSGSGLDADLLDGQHGSYYTGYTDTAIANHLAAVDPHPQYLTEAEGNALYSVLGHTHRLDEITNPNANKTFTMVDNHLQFTWVAPVAGGGIDGALEIEATGNFSGDLVHIHQHTGNPLANTNLVRIEATSTSVLPLYVKSLAAEYNAKFEIIDANKYVKIGANLPGLNRPEIGFYTNVNSNASFIFDFVNTFSDVTISGGRSFELRGNWYTTDGLTKVQAAAINFGNTATGPTSADVAGHFSFRTKAVGGNLADRLFIASSGNVLIGTTVEGANGRLQIVTHTDATGGIGFGTDVSLYRSGINVLKTDDYLEVALPVGIGTAPLITNYLRLSGTLTSGINQVCLAPVPIFGTDATAFAAVLDSFPTSANGSGATYTSCYHIRLNNWSKNAADTITTQVGVQIQDLTSGDTNIGIRSLVSVGTNKYNIYASGTAFNYFAGNTAIGTAFPASIYSLFLSGSLTSGVNQWGASFQPVFSSEATSNMRVFQTRISTAAASFQVSAATNIFIDVTSFGAGSSAASLYGIFISDLVGKTGSGITAGLRSQIASGTGNWNLYLDGAASNYFRGTLRISTTATALPNQGLAVDGAIVSGSTSQWGINSAVVCSSEATSIRATQTKVSTATAVHTVTSAMGLYVDTPTLGSGSTITNLYGIYVAAQSGSSNYAVGLRVDDFTAVTTSYAAELRLAAGTGKWNLYANGTALNYFAGTVLFGTTTDSANGKIQLTTHTTAAGGIGFGTDVTLYRSTTDVLKTDDSLEVTGRIGIGGAPQSSAKLYSRGNISGAASVFAFRAADVIQSSVTVSYNTVSSAPSTVDEVFTLPTLAHFAAGNVTKGASATISTQVGLLITDLSAGTINIGVRTQVSDGTNKYNLYLDGTAPNHIAGRVAIGQIPVASDVLRLAGALTSGITQRAITITNTFGVDGLTQLSGITIIPTLANGSGVTYPYYAGLLVANPVKNASDTLTANYGIDISDLTSGANNYGIRSIVSSGTNKWNLYISGTANNYVNGSLFVGSNTNYSTRAEKIHVHQVSSSLGVGLFFADWGNTNLAPGITFAHSFSNTIGVHGIGADYPNALGALRFQTSNGTAFVDTAYITVYLDGVQSVSSLPSKITFWTTAASTTFPREVLSIAASGQVAFGTSGMTVPPIRVYTTTGLPQVLLENTGRALEFFPGTLNCNIDFSSEGNLNFVSKLYSERGTNGASRSTRATIIGTTGAFLIGTTTDDTINKLQVTGSAKITGNFEFTGTGTLPGYVANSRTVTGQNSISGGGDLSADRTLALVNDSAAPGNSKYYGTDGGGTKGFFDLPSGAYTAELAQDDVGGILTDTDTIDLIYIDATPSISANVRMQMSITSDVNGIMLSGDAASPGNSMFYGTNGSGTKGWYAQASVPTPTGVFSDLQFSLLQSDGTLNAASGVQTWAGTNKTGQDVFTVAANTTYRIKGQWIVNTGGTTHTTAMAFSVSGATVTDFQYLVNLWNAAANTIATAQSTTHVSGVASKVLNATSTAVYTLIQFEGILVIGANGGTITPQINFSANPTGTNLMKRGSWTSFEKLGADTVTLAGGWA